MPILVQYELVMGIFSVKNCFYVVCVFLHYRDEFQA